MTKKEQNIKRILPYSCEVNKILMKNHMLLWFLIKSYK